MTRPDKQDYDFHKELQRAQYTMHLEGYIDYLERKVRGLAGIVDLQQHNFKMGANPVTLTTDPPKVDRNFRKVLFKKHVRISKEVEETYPGTLPYCLQADFENEGLFHQWVSGDSGTYAIVELSDGTITEVMPQHIKFIFNVLL